MADIKKVIKGLETCIPMKYETNEEKECRHEQCPYGRENYKPMNGCFWDLMADALELLKELNIKGHWIPIGGVADCNGVRIHSFKCSECGEEAAAQFSYCPNCGSSMMYEVL